MSEKMREILEQKYMHINAKMWDTITNESESVDWKDLKQSDWTQIRLLYALGSNNAYSYDVPQFLRGTINHCFLSHDKSLMLILGYDSEINEIINRCGDSLETLRIAYSFFDPINTFRFLNLKYLEIRTGSHTTAITKELRGLEHLHRLKTLCIIGDISVSYLSVSQMKELQCFDISRNQCLRTITGLGKLQNLKEVSLYDLPQLTVDELPQTPSLRRLYIGSCRGIKTLPRFDLLPNLELLSLYRYSFATAIDVSPLRKLKTLVICENPDLLQVTGLEKLSELEHFDISYTGLRTIPQEIRGKNLKRFDLSGLDLDDIPDWILDFSLAFTRSDEAYNNGIYLYQTRIKGVDISIFDQPLDVIKKWFNERDIIPLQEVKVVFLGDGEAGKTHTIARLLNDGNDPKLEDFDDKATPGIVITDKDYDLDGMPVKVHFWDFGGQEILHSMHRMFLTERTLYVVLINARDDTQNERARYWLHNIRSFAGNSPVLLVLNKIDQNPNASIAKQDLQRMYEGLTDVVSMSALEYTAEQFNNTFTAALLKQISQIGTLGTLWPSSWLKLKTGLETMTTHYIHGVDYEDMCEDCGVAQNREELLNWFNDLGVSFCYAGNARLEDYVILRPEWLTNAIYILLFNKCDETQNGILPHSAIHRMLHPKKSERDKYRRVLRDVVYNVQETDYVLDVIRKFRLSYKVRSDAEFIPALCQRESMPVAQEYAADPDTLEFQMTYEYLPENVIHRLMVELRQDLDTQNVWRTGAKFVQEGTSLSAVVMSDGNLLRIFVRSENDLHRPNTYLSILKENIDRINRDMKLTPPFAEVVYKTDSGKECFDYQDLLDAQKDGEQTYRSKRLRRRIPIQDILNQTGRGVELELLELRDNILTACMQMQSNRSFWTVNDEVRIEDERNTYLRDTLINRGYLVNDQHLQGLGSRNRGYGELDLDIRQEAAIPWTILEALRIKDGSKSDWNRHLKKLLDNYNPSGLNHLFLLTYVDASKDDFEEIMRKFSEHVKWHDELPYVRLPSTFSHVPLRRHGNPAYLQVMRCTYDRNGAPTTVTHIFVRMGE